MTDAPRRPYDLSPALAAAAAQHAENAAASRRDAVEPSVVAAQADMLAAGVAPPREQRLADEVADIVRTRGLTPEEARCLLDVGRDVRGSTREALLAAVGAGPRKDEAAAQAASANAEDLRAEAVPQLDLGDLLGDIPDLHDHIHEVARVHDMPVALPAMWALTLLSALLGDRVRVVVPEDDVSGKAWQVPVHLWTLGAVETGRLKSGLARDVQGKLLEVWEVNAQRAWRPALALDRHRRQRAKTTLESRKADDAERVAATELLEDPALHEVRPYVIKATPEEFMHRMLRSGFVALMQLEGGAFFSDFVHQERSKLEAALGGFSGDPGGSETRTETKAGDRAPFHELHCVVGILVQPYKLQPSDPKDRKRLAEAAEQGLFGRFLVHVDDPDAGGPTNALDEETRRTASRRYDELMRRIALCAPLTEEAARVHGDRAIGDLVRLHPLAPRSGTARDAEFCGRVVRFEPAAARRLLAFQRAWREEGKRLSRDGDVALCAVARRLGEQAARLAAIRAVARAGRLDRFELVALDDVERAVRFCEKFAWPHARLALDRAQAGELEALERKVLQALNKHRDRWWTPGSFRDRVARTWPEVRGEQFRDRKPPLVRAFESLADRGRLRTRPTQRGKALEYQIV